MKTHTINRWIRHFLFCTVVLGLGFRPSAMQAEDADEKAQMKEVDPAIREASIPSTVDEARGRARWLHETIHGALQVMHRDFFGDDDTLTLPSQSLDDVFKELARSWDVEIRWLGVNATKGEDHKPQDEFEKAAAKALESGKSEFEDVVRGRFRYVGAIRLQNECLKCHVPNRTSLEDRVAGLAISIPLKRTTSPARE